ncbi:MOSC domain-containing protein [Bailinhaonella thermotolerans]|uniref:MOSC domain-containing protein n=1 Tax=Bailinhaonella thermotolerans TaxID=1070861 RepID=A0A3A4ATW1_9ACTN|nr:MOSC domain-containing protein [Bailinhaonella thermotolerans]
MTELNVYPLKSGGGTSLERAEMTPRGLRYDREFMLITPEGAHLSQREVPRMALMRPAYDGEKLVVEVADPALALTPFVHEPRAEGPAHDVTVHRKPCRGVDQGDEAAEWFSGLLGLECRLVRFPDGDTRPTGRGGGEVAYADGYPLLVISQESLDDLNSRLAEPLPMNRFRPNLVIEGWGRPFGEDHVRRMRVGGVEIEVVKPCGRCVLTTVDQDAGVRTREPLRTLAKFRNIGKEILFGQNAIPRTTGEIALGDEVEILETAEPPA